MQVSSLSLLATTLLSASLLCSIAAASETAARATYSLHSRYVGGGQSTGGWKYQGSISLGAQAGLSSVSDVSPSRDNIKFVTASDRNEELQPATDSGVLDLESTSSAEGWLQLLLLDGDTKSVKQAELARGILASTKACLLPSPLVVTLHLPPAPGAKTKTGHDPAPLSASLRPQSLSLHFEGISTAPLNESGCPAERGRSAAEVAKPQAPVRVAVYRAAGAGAPPPRQAPRLTADGSPLGEGEDAPPVKEKSFVQKYWYYLLPVVILLAIPSELADSGDDGEAEVDDAPRLGGGGSGSGGAGKKGAPGAAGAGMRRIR
ncbi:NUCLEIC ACID BINGING PROTEIN [Ceraceosorus bombacis]|uniref:NUCLEIC ACID BINGING PROTEIN n=1 Tax=Ceraceosorus bombacis TaxID=401625 RepID=A0A0P1BG90_9BASI|nr:NUCLEIC ACID BINGING PROTEIN [Ceraceosorus bombacis]